MNQVIFSLEKSENGINCIKEAKQVVRLYPSYLRLQYCFTY